MKHIILEGDTVTVEELPTLTLVDSIEKSYDPRNTVGQVPILTKEKMSEIQARNALKNKK